MVDSDLQKSSMDLSPDINTTPKMSTLPAPVVVPPPPPPNSAIPPPPSMIYHHSSGTTTSRRATMATMGLGMVGGGDWPSTNLGSPGLICTIPQLPKEKYNWHTVVDGFSKSLSILILLRVVINIRSIPDNLKIPL
ncbi:unnamed protein product [Lepeophtheirus salmonis]|uniref:(salmon louse) hypothetical protein n=1 Tax=Lepeophtheirus salmonis TaxID=72036 RepID=A0A7R8CFR1_LEPSM|nr:unnamed protein product [Lepeophtheirus salmonis]CAF2808734.1 unnamed protein product [Lepeophtheirus salmonis]